MELALNGRPHHWWVGLVVLALPGACMTGEDSLPSADGGSGVGVGGIGVGGIGVGGIGVGGSSGTSSGSGGAGGDSGGAGGQGGIGGNSGAGGAAGIGGAGGTGGTGGVGGSIGSIINCTTATCSGGDICCVDDDNMNANFCAAPGNCGSNHIEVHCQNPSDCSGSGICCGIFDVMGFSQGYEQVICDPTCNPPQQDLTGLIMCGDDPSVCPNGVMSCVDSMVLPAGFKYCD